jgi:hypothetical protein
MRETKRTAICRKGLLLIVLFASAVLNPPAWADDDTNFAFVDPSAASLSPDTSGTLKLDTPIKNAGREGTATVALMGDSQCTDDKVATPKTLKSLKKNVARIEHFEISNVKLPATCYIALVSGADGNSSLKPVKLNQVYAKSGVLIAVGVCLALSALAVLFGWAFACEPLLYELGAPAWDFAKSWTSTTTLVGGVISTALALGALPELTKYASKSGYAILALLASLVAVVAPFVFTVFRTGTVERDPKTGVYSVVYQGWLGPCLLSCAMTLFAGLMQLVVFFLLLHEVFQGYGFWSYSKSNDPVSCNLGAILVSGVTVVFWVYSVYSIYLTVKLQRDAKAMAAPVPDQAPGFAPPTPTPIKSRLLPWPML